MAADELKREPEAPVRAPVLPPAFDTSTGWARLLDRIDHIVVAALLVAVGTMVAVVTIQVALRYGLNRSIDWADEVSRLAFVWSIFLGIPLGIRQGAHIGIDLLVERLPGAAKRPLRKAAAALCALMMVAIAQAAFAVALEQWDELMSVLDWSVGWFIVPVGVGSVLSALHLLRIAVQGPPLSSPVSPE